MVLDLSTLNSEFVTKKNRLVGDGKRAGGCAVGKRLVVAFQESTKAVLVPVFF